MLYVAIETVRKTLRQVTGSWSIRIDTPARIPQLLRPQVRISHIREPWTAFFAERSPLQLRLNIGFGAGRLANGV